MINQILSFLGGVPRQDYDDLERKLAMQQLQLEALRGQLGEAINMVDSDSRRRDRLLWGALRTLAAATPDGHNAIGRRRLDDEFMADDDHAAAVQGKTAVISFENARRPR